MTTQSTVQAQPERSAKAPKTYSVTLHGTEGATLRITATFRRDGTGVTWAAHTTKAANGKRHSERGATQQHATADAARAAVDKLAEESVKRGWVRKTAQGGFRAKPDAFDVNSLPAPGPRSASTSKKK
jgi:hypothetical protein